MSSHCDCLFHCSNKEEVVTKLHSPFFPFCVCVCVLQLQTRACNRKQKQQGCIIQTRIVQITVKPESTQCSSCTTSSILMNQENNQNTNNRKQLHCTNGTAIHLTGPIQRSLKFEGFDPCGQP